MKKKFLYYFMLVVLLFYCASNASGLSIMGIDVEPVAVDETYDSGWNSDVGAPQKDDIYDYLHKFDADDDGSYIDETWWTGRERFVQGLTIQTFTGSDATPDVSNGGSAVVQLWRSIDTTTITNFDDGDDHSEFGDGDSFILLFNSAQIIDCSDNANIKGHGNNDYTGAAGEWALFVYDDTNNYWVMKTSETKSANFTTLRFPNDEAADAALTNLGEVHVRAGQDKITMEMGDSGEVVGEVAVSVLQHIAVPIDFTYVYDRDSAHRLPLFVVNSKVYPNGITIDYWSVKHQKVRTTALDADLKRATDFQAGSVATMDAIDVAGSADESAEDTDSNINSDAVVAAGQHIYIEVAADPVDEDNLAVFEMIFHAEAD